MDFMALDIIKVFLPSTIAFLIGVAATPALTGYLYRNRMWKKKAGKVGLDGAATPIFNELHKGKEVGAPRMGGVVVWFSVFATVGLLLLLDQVTGLSSFEKLNFLSRSQTWIPLATLLLGGVVGLLDDLMEIRGNGDSTRGGMSLRKRLLIVSAIGLLCGAWFYLKLDVSSINLPFLGETEFGIFFILIFALFALGIYSGGIIDGIDGLAGGVFAAMFSAYAGIAFYQSQIDLAAFCLTVVGAILAFLWFNIPPARFYMSETGTMGLTLTLTVVAFMTDVLGSGRGIVALPMIALPLIATTGSVVIQMLSRKFRNGQKVFLVAPLHHHFEALGWPAYKVTMRYWVVATVAAILGFVIALS